MSQKKGFIMHMKKAKIYESVTKMTEAEMEEQDANFMHLDALLNCIP